MYNDVPVYDDRHDDVIWEGRRGEAFGEGVQRNRSSSATDPADVQNRSRRRTWADDGIDRPPSYLGGGGAAAAAVRASTFPAGFNPDGEDRYSYSDLKPKRPSAPKPTFKPKPRLASLGPNQALAKFNFDADQPGDLGFRKGEVITIIKRTESLNDWWTGRIGEKEGIFPRYVQCPSRRGLASELRMSVPDHHSIHSNYVEVA